MSAQQAGTPERPDLAADDTAEAGPLTAAQDLALVALLATGRGADAAQAAGVSERTLRRWLCEPQFRKVYLARREQVFEGATIAITSEMVGMRDVLATIARDPATPAAARVSAARSLLEVGLKLRDAELGERLARVEAAVAEQLEDKR